MEGRGEMRQGMALRQIHETNIEQAFREALERRGLRRGIDFATQYPIRHSFILDFAFPAKKIAVEVDGKKWHSSPEARKRDAFKNQVLKRQGWKVIRFTEDEVLANVDACVEKVLRILGDRTR
jgi:very-short-patch-repair endonuclease